MNPVLSVEVEQATRIVTFNRPQVRNAINADVVAALEVAVREAEQDRTLRAVVLTGAGDAAFVAGADLKRLRSLSDEERKDLDQRMANVVGRLADLPVPVIGAINGVVVGGGCEIALACDLRVGEPHASFTFKHAAMGVTPGWGGLARLAACVGRSTAARLLFTAQPMSADDALRVGLLDEVVAKGESRSRAQEIAASVAQVSPSAVADLKRLIGAAYASKLQDEERRTFLARAVSADHLEALMAFEEKRAPRFGDR